MRPFVHKILVVIEPLLIDEDYYARVEGREIIANLSKVPSPHDSLSFYGATDHPSLACDSPVKPWHAASPSHSEGIELECRLRAWPP